MGREDFISGSILEFRLPSEFGYAYCKILDFREIRTFDGVLVKVFDHIVDRPLDDIAVLATKDLLFGARRMPWLPGTRGKGAWKMKGVLVAADDMNIPDFKYCLSSSYLIEDLSTIGPWYVVSNINQCSYQPYPYENVRHLEDTDITTRISIEKRTAMEYCRIRGLPIQDYFDLNNVVDLICYRQITNIPIYQTLPKNIRGKAIPLTDK